MKTANPNSSIDPQKETLVTRAGPVWQSNEQYLLEQCGFSTPFPDAYNHNGLRVHPDSAASNISRTENIIRTEKIMNVKRKCEESSENIGLTDKRPAKKKPSAAGKDVHYSSKSDLIILKNNAVSRSEAASNGTAENNKMAKLVLHELPEFPAKLKVKVIDIIRVIALHPDGAVVLLRHTEAENDALVEMVRKVASELWRTYSRIRVIRTGCGNITILDTFSSCYSSPNKVLPLSYSTLILNYAVLLIEKKDQEGQSQVLSAALEIEEDENQDVASKFRALVAIGSLMLEGVVKQIAVDFDAENIAS